MAKSKRFVVTSTKLLWVAVAALAFVALVEGAILKHVYMTNMALQTNGVKEAVIDAVRGLNTDLATDPQTGRRTIPSVKVTFAADPTAHIFYHPGSTETSVALIDASVQGQAIYRLRNTVKFETAFNEVPTLQSCSRQVVISFNSPNAEDFGENYTQKSSKRLRDGRTAYILQNDCPLDGQNLLKFAQAVESL